MDSLLIWTIVKLIIGLLIAGELIYVICSSKSASDFTYYVARPFGIERWKMATGFIIRAILIAVSSAFLYSGIAYFL